MPEHVRPDVDAISQQGAPGGFELVLASAAFRTISDHIPGHELRTMAAALAQHPGPALTPVIDLVRQLVAIVLGSDGQRTSRDRRFADPAWRTNPLLRRIALGYLASCQAVERIVADAEVDWRTKERVRLLADNVLAAAAPTNNPVLHPLSWQCAIDTGGRSWLRGLRQLVTDMGAPPRLPATVDTTAFSIGEDIAATAGKVVWRSELLELIQYAPTAETVDETPVLFVASPVNKYYLLDLSPHRSVIAAELACGRQVFVISWVNPDQRHSDAGLDEYASSILDSLDAIDAITGGDRAHLLGLCGGGQLAVAVAGYLCGHRAAGAVGDADAGDRRCRLRAGRAAGRTARSEGGKTSDRARHQRRVLRRQEQRCDVRLASTQRRDLGQCRERLSARSATAG
jgi:polyhydroxyalkanoate synthase subunit PhaC